MKNNIKLFLIMFKIGLFTFGGGYAMIPLLENEFVNKKAWLQHEEFVDMLAISESSPGPIAINMATFVGFSQAGILGAALATIGVVLPAFVVILIVSMFVKNLLSLTPVKAFLDGIKPVITALILSTAITLGLSILIGIKTISSQFAFDYIALIILSIVISVHFLHLKLKKKTISPILLICISAVLGMVLYSI